MFYSATTNGFYDTNLHSWLPDDAVEITEERHQELLALQSSGYEIIDSGDGTPTTRPSAPDDFHKWNGSAWVADSTKKQEAITKAEAKIDEATHTAILNGFSHGGHSFHMTEIRQFNHHVNFGLRDFLTYPYPVKSNDGYLDIANADDYATFFLAGATHKETAIRNGQAQKDALPAMTTAEIIAFINS